MTAVGFEIWRECLQNMSKAHIDYVEIWDSFVWNLGSEVGRDSTYMNGSWLKTRITKEGYCHPASRLQRRHEPTMNVLVEIVVEYMEHKLGDGCQCEEHGKEDIGKCQYFNPELTKSTKEQRFAFTSCQGQLTHHKIGRDIVSLLDNVPWELRAS